MSSTFRQGLAKIMKREDYKEIIPYIKSEKPGNLDIKGFNSVLSGLSNLTADDGFSSREVCKVITSVHTTYNFTETTYTSFIKLYSGNVCYDLKKVFTLLGYMKSNNFRIKRRTMAPIFDMCAREELHNEACQFYADCKALNITLEPVDYINLLNTPYDYFTKTLLMDMSKTVTSFNEEEISMIMEIFLLNTDLEVDDIGNSESVNDDDEFNVDFNFPSFNLSDGEKRGIKDSFLLFVNKFFSRNAKKFIDYTKALNKMDYDMVIDGANIGFFKKGKDSGKNLDYRQIKSFVIESVSSGYNPLLILHSRHNNGGNELKEILEVCPNYFFTPKGMDDDIFWLYASLMKSGCYLLTNDELRNHLFYMNLGDKFVDWKMYSRVTYDLRNGRDIIFNTPKKYMEKVHYDYSDNGLYIPYEKMNSGNVEWKYFRTG